MTWSDLSDVLDVPFAVVGTVATRLYAPERSTRDLDIIVAVKSVAAAPMAMERAGWQRAGVPTIGGDSWRSQRGEEVDVLEGHEI